MLYFFVRTLFFSVRALSLVLTHFGHHTITLFIITYHHRRPYHFRIFLLPTDDDIEQDDSLVRNNSYFEPPKGRNKNLDDNIDMTKICNNKKSFNITRNARQAIDNLANNSSIVIKEADKGEALL